MIANDLTHLLRERKLRITPQRQAILAAFRDHEDHLSAEEVTARAAVLVPNIGRGTVYATLAELTEVGLLASVGSSEPIRYETNLEPHDHLRCRLCLRMYDVDLGGERLNRRAPPGFTIEAVAVHAEGVCAQCHEYERGLRDGAARAIEHETLENDDLDALACVKLDSPIGELALVASSEGIVHVAYSDHADFDGLLVRSRSRRGATAARARLGVLGDALDAYFAGSHAPIHELIDWRLFTGEQRAALVSVQRIPFAQPCSYECLDSHLDAYARGRLMGVNPLPLLTPCHRVTRGAERPEVYVGGVERLHFLQALENA